MIKSFRLGNFKAFAETQRIPIRPLTLIFGVNSAGKSSIIHGILFAQNALQNKQLDTHQMPIGGDSVDLGGFRQYVYKRETDRQMNWSIELDASKLAKRLQEILGPTENLTLSVHVGLSAKPGKGSELANGSDNAISDAKDPAVLTYEILADGDFLLNMSRRSDDTLQMDRLNVRHRVMQHLLKAIAESVTTTTGLNAKDLENLATIIDELVPKMKAMGDKFIPEGLATVGQAERLTEDRLFPVSRGRRADDLAAAIEFFLPRSINELLQGLYQTVSSRMKDVRYLGPLRSYPPRHLAFAQYNDSNWVAGGGEAWDVARKNQEVLRHVNRWLSSEKLKTPYELEVRPFLSSGDLLTFLPDHLFTSLKEAFRAFMKETAEGGGNADSASLIVQEVSDEGELEPGSEAPLITNIISHSTDVDSSAREFLRRLLGQSADDLSELVLIDKRSNTIVSHRDVGIGISQVLPVLVSAYANHDLLVAIEQPEIHLHPALQAELGDVFIQSALGNRKNAFILETHSEHLILRIMRRIRESSTGKLPGDIPSISPNDVSVLFVEPDGSRSIIREMALNENGELVKAWPGGFFEESLREVLPTDVD